MQTQKNRNLKWQWYVNYCEVYIIFFKHNFILFKTEKCKYDLLAGLALETKDLIVANPHINLQWNTGRTCAGITLFSRIRKRMKDRSFHKPFRSRWRCKSLVTYVHTKAWRDVHTNNWMSHVYVHCLYIFLVGGGILYHFSTIVSKWSIPQNTLLIRIPFLLDLKEILFLRVYCMLGTVLAFYT